MRLSVKKAAPAAINGAAQQEIRGRAAVESSEAAVAASTIRTISAPAGYASRLLRSLASRNRLRLSYVRQEHRAVRNGLLTLYM